MNLNTITKAILILALSILAGASTKLPSVPENTTETGIQQWKLVKTVLNLKKTRFNADEPIIIDVWVENQTEQDIELYHFNPLLSSTGTPDFVIVRVPDGKEFSIHPGIYGDAWGKWYQPISKDKPSYSSGRLCLPSGNRIHLLNGDLRLTIIRAREYCQHAIDMKYVIPASTRIHYQEIVRFADDFLSGGIFDIYVRTYSRSQTIRITVDKENKNSGQLNL